MMHEIDDPVLLSPSQLVSSSKLSKNLGAYLNEARKRPIFVTREQEVEAVLLNLDDYRELLREEQKIEDLYLAVLALRRLAENAETPERLLEMDEVLERFGITREELAEAPGDEMES
ncbi:type II toxin-antitoxin system Phd/YefM family antitoxin [Neomoorella thermoacetica]|uniref:type II toxin-antitoxin system Phd/YefM family antitoxin n=1 Tax=Neomoorella thermoacetica TaxID=1525 RepID=UPI0030D161DC